jgi:uncharacterized protein YjdB
MRRAITVVVALFAVACVEFTEPELLVLPETLVLRAVGDTARLDVVFTGTNVGGRNAGLRRFSSDDATIARVNADGVVRGVSPGQTIVRVTSLDRSVAVPVRVN